MQLVALLLIGFSLFTAALLILGNILQHREPYPLSSKLAGFALVISLAAIQWLHLQFILEQEDQAFSPLYILLLYCIAPSFYFYSRRLLAAPARLSPWQLLHALPVPASLYIPLNGALPLAFLIGSGYLLWLAVTVYAMRRQRRRFKFELLALAVFFAIAIGVVALGFIWPLLTESAFIASYSILIGLAFFAVTLTLLRFPSITADVAEAAQAAYAESTLKNVDRQAVLAHLDKLMREEKLYMLETLNLAMLAEQLQLTPHQLSELINTEFQQGFSRYIRQHRIEAAKKLLLAEPEASVLSIGLSVGFSTQSNFYTAFRDMVGMAPGQYRKQLQQRGQDTFQGVALPDRD
ncbi:AraC family transcriptional regulator [Methylobacter sp. BBA5.1]|jgi:AraC-like DNA-binding protein|uniref:helix-turn-helix domain-containing protein n=1 Tax=Methylobacter sp. BBA5.1 TaxID=1495064 RepID=UPI00056CFC38|nr:helix-turn-helix domain-containing protein [Methylobacter sp. BBA5.1]